MEFKKMTVKQWSIVLVSILAIYGLAGFFLVPVVGKNILQNKLSQHLDREIFIERIAVNPFTFTVAIHGLVATEKNKEIFFSVDKAFADLSFSSLLIFRLGVSEIFLGSPYVHVIQNADGSFNFSDIFAPDKKGPGEGSDESSDTGSGVQADKGPEKGEGSGAPALNLMGFVVENLSVKGGEFKFTDQKTGTSHEVGTFWLSLPRISTREKDRYDTAVMDIGFVLNRAGLELHVESTPFAGDMATRADVKITDMDLVHYLAYLPIPETLQIKGANLNLEVHAEYRSKASDPFFSLEGKLGLLNADVKDKTGQDIIQFPELSIDMAPSNLLARQLTLSKILVKRPDLNLIRDKRGDLNLSGHIPETTEVVQDKETGQNNGSDHAGESDLDRDAGQNMQAGRNKENGQVQGPGSSPVNPGPAFVLDLADAEIRNGAVHFKDLATGREFSTKIFPLNVRVNNFKAGKTISGEWVLDLEAETGEMIDSKGKFQTHPTRVHGLVNLSGLVLNTYAPYYENLVNMTVKDGRLDLSAGFDMSRTGDEPELSVTGRNIEVQSLIIDDAEEEIINIPQFKVRGMVIDLENRKVDTGAVTARNGKILIRRLKDGRINLVKSFSPKPLVQDPPDQSLAVTTGDPVGGAPEEGEPDKEKPDDAKPVGIAPQRHASPWEITMSSFKADGFDLAFNDVSPTDPVVIDLSRLSVTGSDLRSFGKEKGNLEVRMDWNEQGRIGIKGEMIPSLLRAAMELNLEKIDIQSLQPYFTDGVKILVTEGYLNTDGKLDLDLGQDSGPQVKFDGQTSVTNFICLDKHTAKDFFKCNSFYLSGLGVSLFPMDLTIKDISLTDFYSRIIVDDSGELNLNTIFRKDDGQGKNLDGSGDTGQNKDETPGKDMEPDNGKAGAEVRDKEGKSEIPGPDDSPRISIESVTLQGGDIRFSDYLTQPHFTASMRQIAGSLTGLSSTQESRASLNLKGLHGNSSPLDIVGTINPLAKEKFIDIDISFKDIELTNFTPYSSRFLGYKIEKGKLILDLEYIIEGDRLKSENRVKFNQFTLGERVESKDAVSLPVGLAISLLKNREGEINLDLPVTGNLNDPEFKIGSIVLKMISNLILKVVTSPFSIIGSMFGGGEELSYIEFGYGEADIRDEDFKKIDTLARILQEKPSINLEILGIYDRLRDAEGLREKGFMDQIKAMKLKQTVASGSSAGTLEQVVITPQEMAPYILAAYADAQFPKPRDEAGGEKQIDLEEKKKLLMTQIDIGEDELRLLAMNRSENIKAYLISTGTVEPERIFLLEPGGHGSEGETTGKVKFSLK